MKYLEADKFYMEPESATVNIGKDWEELYEEEKYIDDPNDPLSWDDWGGNYLIKVRFVDKKWEEVEY
jgi:hypothetical protein